MAEIEIIMCNKIRDVWIKVLINYNGKTVKKTVQGGELWLDGLGKNIDIKSYMNWLLKAEQIQYFTCKKEKCLSERSVVLLGESFTKITLK